MAQRSSAIDESAGRDREKRISRIRLSGDFDVSNRDELAALLEPATTASAVILDLTDVTFIDSTALGCFVWLRKLVRERHDGTVRLIGLSPHLRRVFSITGLDLIFDIEPSEGGTR